MRSVSRVLPGVASETVVYDGAEFGGIATNIRKLALPQAWWFVVCGGVIDLQKKDTQPAWEMQFWLT